MSRDNYSVKDLTPRELRAKITELPSRYSDPERYNLISANISRARSALNWIYIALHFEYWENEKIFRTIAQLCYSKNYEGEWANVQEFLENEELSTNSFEEWYIDKYGPHDFFGNFLRECVRQSRTIKVLDRNQEDRRPVRYPQFRRGYRDKGSLRLPHEFHGDRPYTEKIDRRGKVNHPLLKEFFSDWGSPGDHIP